MAWATLPIKDIRRHIHTLYLHLLKECFYTAVMIEKILLLAYLEQRTLRPEMPQAGPAHKGNAQASSYGSFVPGMNLRGGCEMLVWLDCRQVTVHTASPVCYSGELSRGPSSQMHSAYQPTCVYEPTASVLSVQAGRIYMGWRGDRSSRNVQACTRPIEHRRAHPVGHTVGDCLRRLRASSANEPMSPLPAGDKDHGRPGAHTCEVGEISTTFFVNLRRRVTFSLARAFCGRLKATD